jgi:ankyrin repeat protein
MNISRQLLFFLLNLMILVNVNASTLSISYPKITPKNDAEKAMLSYRSEDQKVYRAMLKKYGPNIKTENSTICSSILGLATRHGDTKEVKHLLSLGAKVDICNNKPLMIAIGQNRLNALKFLIEAGAPIDKPNIFGERALESALKEFPIFSNYNPKSASTKQSVEDSIGIIQLLVNKGADLSLKTKNGLSYSEYFNKQFANHSYHPDYKKYQSKVLKILTP